MYEGMKMLERYCEAPKHVGEPQYGLIRQCLDYDGVDSVLLAGGKCREGTTPFGWVVSRLGLPSVYQAEKAASRCIEAGIAPEVIHYGKLGKNVESKFTIGGPTLMDSIVNPLTAHLKAEEGGGGIEKSKLRVSLFERNPFATFASWKKLYLNPFYTQSYNLTSQDLLINFITAHKTQQELYEQLQSEDIPATIFVQELLEYRGDAADNMKARAEEEHVAGILSHVFANTGMNVTDEQIMGAISNWEPVNAEVAKEKMVFPREPEYDFETALLKSISRDAYRYPGQNNNDILRILTGEEIACIRGHGMTDFYNELLVDSVRDFKLDMRLYNDLFILPEFSRN